MFNLAESKKGESMSVFEALMLMIAFLTLVLRIIDDKEDIRKNSLIGEFFRTKTEA